MSEPTARPEATDPAAPLSVEDHEAAARPVLPPGVFDFIAGGAGEERTLAENRRAFARWVLRPRVLRGVVRPELAIELLGSSAAMPVLVAPWAYQRMVHPDGDVATARGAAAAGTIATISSSGYDLLEAVAATGDAPRWWQLYVSEDRGFTATMLQRVAAAGFRAIVWTVDLPAYGIRRRDERNAFEIPPELVPAGFGNDGRITWDDLPWIREHAGGLPVLLKGILTREDAELAVRAGADGIVVSNHGARQLDAVPAALDALPEVVEAVAGAVPVLLDGGVRTGTDVLTALALGATAVLVGRPAAWGLALGGADGVERVLGILREELENAMTLCGCASVAEIGPELVAPAR
ncbi:MAG TPA: alpha-hydroxy acid oxidase [Actinomycetota bacterium]|nr:alpha-hydroxy acid oxidase [Actinomycetota bacterium]